MKFIERYDARMKIKGEKAFTYEYEYLENPDYDPNKPEDIDGNYKQIIDPHCPTAQMFCEQISLPALEHGYLAYKYSATKNAAYNEALNLIAVHLIAPPEWLAKLILEKNLKTAKRKNGYLIAHNEKEFRKQNGFVEFRNSGNNQLNFEMKKAAELKNTRLDKFWKTYEAHLDKLIDDLP